MSAQQGVNESEAVSLILKIFEERTAESVSTEEEIDYREQKAAQKTQRITRIALVISFLLTPVIFSLIATLVFDMGEITDRMQKMSGYVASMREDFTEVAGLMTNMDASVTRMSTNISVIPSIDTQVAGMDENFTQMVAAMQGITPNVTQIDQNLTVMEQDMVQMNSLFGQLNYSVLSIGQDVNQMSKPMRFMPPFFGN